VSPELTTDQKGAIAEAAIVLAAVERGIGVYRPVAEGGRYDLIFDVRGRLMRVQCKSAAKQGDVLHIRCYSSRRTLGGMVSRPYTAEQIDAITAYAHDLRRCYFIPVGLVDGRRALSLRLAPARNGQRSRIHWAGDFEFDRLHFNAPGAIAQLGERLAGSQKVGGSSPPGSTLADVARAGSPPR
jgi:PD-(D/E)XK endonuclease